MCSEPRGSGKYINFRLHSSSFVYTVFLLFVPQAIRVIIHQRVSKKLKKKTNYIHNYTLIHLWWCTYCWVALFFAFPENLYFINDEHYGIFFRFHFYHDCRSGFFLFLILVKLTWWKWKKKCEPSLWYLWKKEKGMIEKTLDYVKGIIITRKKKRERNKERNKQIRYVLSPCNFFFYFFKFPLYLHIWWATDNCYCKNTSKNSSHIHFYRMRTQKSLETFEYFSLFLSLACRKFHYLNIVYIKDKRKWSNISFKYISYCSITTIENVK